MERFTAGRPYGIWIPQEAVVLATLHGSRVVPVRLTAAEVSVSSRR